MKRSTVTKLSLLVLVALVASAVFAALAFAGQGGTPGPPASAYLIIDGTTIPVQSFSVGLSNTVTLGSASGGAGAGKATFQDMTVTVPVDASFPVLSIAVARGDVFQHAQLVERWTDTNGNPVALRYTFGVVFISSIKQSGDSAAPTELVTLKYTQAGWSYYGSGDPTGTPTATRGWSVVDNQPVQCTGTPNPTLC